MNKPIKFFSLALVLVMLSTYSPNYKTSSRISFFSIKNIKIKDAKIINSEDMIERLQDLKGKNLLFINKKNIISAISNFDFVSGFKLKKIYPETIEIQIVEKKPIAIYIKGKSKFYISEKGDLIKFIELNDYNELPLIFGKKANFDLFFKELKEINFPTDRIKSLHHFEIGRWDIALKNNKLIKLPKNNYKIQLENFLSIIDDSNFEKYNIFDYRIKEQLILN